MLKNERNALIAYFGLAYLITWGFQIAGLVLASQQGIALGNEENFLHFLALLSGDVHLPYLVFALGAGPSISAFVVLVFTEGKAGLRTWLAQCLKWRIPVRWYLIALALPLSVTAGSLLLGLLSTGFKPLQFNPRLPWADFLPFSLFMIVFTGIVEEPGWRGYALPRLQKYYTAEKASWILGLLWGAWHIPAMIYLYRDAPLIVLLVSIAGMLFGTVGWTMVNTWLYNCTSSVFLIILLHGWGNAVQSYFVLSTGNPLAVTAYGVLPWALAVYLSRKYGDDNFAPTPRLTAG
jgi:uncharacterized protein